MTNKTMNDDSGAIRFRYYSNRAGSLVAHRAFEVALRKHIRILAFFLFDLRRRFITAKHLSKYFHRVAAISLPLLMKHNVAIQWRQKVERSGAFWRPTGIDLLCLYQFLPQVIILPSCIF